MQINHNPMKGVNIRFSPEEIEDAMIFLTVMAEGFRQMGKTELAGQITAAMKNIESREPSSQTYS